MMSFQAYGDSALLINFKQGIDPDINRLVIQWYQTITSTAIKGISFCIPAYCSITVGYQPDLVSYHQLCEIIALLEIPQIVGTKSRKLRIPVCYHDEFAPDLQEVGRQTGLTKPEIIALHTAQEYQVYMIGFLPGFAYMGALDKKLKCGRKETPRLKVPARSVGLAGLQTGIYPGQAPGGWQIIGCTPVEIFDAKKEMPCLFQPGDRVTFYSITPFRFLEMERDPAFSSWSDEVLS